MGIDLEAVSQAVADRQIWLPERPVTIAIHSKIILMDKEAAIQKLMMPRYIQTHTTILVDAKTQFTFLRLRPFGFLISELTSLFCSYWTFSQVQFISILMSHKERIPCS